MLAIAILAVIAEVMVRRSAPILKGRILETLSARFGGRVELDTLDVSVLRGLELRGGGLRIFAPDDAAAAVATEPLISVGQFELHTGWRSLFLHPMRADTVHVTRLTVALPPRGVRGRMAGRDQRRGTMEVVVGRIVCDDSHLVIETEKAGRAPKIFDLRHIELEQMGPNAPWRYDATLGNAVPRGDIHAQGTFGPWLEQSPADSTVTGSYTFDHADLSAIKGIGGMLSSAGEFDGRLNRINVHGTADVPNFSLSTANHAMPLHTKFHAIVDATDGDTYLKPVDARLGETGFRCEGSVVNQAGVGHTIDLDVTVPDGRVEDLLRLAVKTRPVVMTARLSMRVKLHIAPGREGVMRKLRLGGGFSLEQVHLSNPEWQGKVNEVSLRAQGYSAEVRTGLPDAAAAMRGTFALSGERLAFNDLAYTVPGATVAMSGLYSLDGEQFDFSGKVRTEARVSQMVSSWWKQILLYPANQLFQKNGAGTELPFTLRGTKGAPRFALDLFANSKKGGKTAPTRSGAGLGR